MDRTERFYKIDQLLRQRRYVSLAQLMDELSVSRATVKRDLEYMRDRMNAPITWNRDHRGYQYDKTPDMERQSLPGLWFNAAEAHALLTMDHLLSQLQPDLLAPHIDPLRSRIHQLLEFNEHQLDEVKRRIKIMHVSARPFEPGCFGSISHALLVRRRLQIGHRNRQSGVLTTREISPQRLAYYRDNWYLDAYCHLRNALRTFSLDLIEQVEILDQKADDIPNDQLDEILSVGYGIFSGKDTSIAVLRFSQEKSAWVSKEQWHPDQSIQQEEDGSLVMSIPYSNDTELVMEILRHGDQVEVLEPPELRNKVRDCSYKTLSQYKQKT